MGVTLSAFKRQELASCLDAFKALAFHPGNDLIQVSLLAPSACPLMQVMTECRQLIPISSMQALSYVLIHCGTQQAVCQRLARR